MALDFPANPVNGQVYGSYTYNSTVGAWQSREDSRTVAVLSSTVPTSANPGDIWVNTNDGISFVYYNDGTSAQWIEMLPSGVPLLNTKANISGDTFTGNVTAPRFISNTTTGTAPFGVASTTLVTNLNADLLDGNHSTAFAPAAGSVDLVTLGTVTSGKWNASPIDVNYGGTGTSTLTSGAYLKGAGTSAITAQTGIPATDITSGLLDIARGGTGTTLGAGGVEIVATSTSVNAGSASIAADGLITFSGVTTLGLNGIFNSSYDNYTVVVTNYASTSAGSNQAIQLRSGGTTVTSATYQWYGYRFVSWSNAAIAGNGSTSWYLMESISQSNPYYTSIMQFITPFNSNEYTRYVNSSYIYGGSYGMAISNGMNASLASHDGITLTFTAASSGRVKVYGYR